MKTRWGLPLFVVAVIAILLGVLRVLDRAPVSVVPASDRSTFSAERAFAHLQTLLAENVPHPSGSAANRVVADRIEAALRAAGYEPEIQEGLKCSPLAPGCSVVRNIISDNEGPGVFAGQTPCALLPPGFVEVPDCYLANLRAFVGEANVILDGNVIQSSGSTGIVLFPGTRGTLRNNRIWANELSGLFGWGATINSEADQYDLNEEHAAELREALALYVGHARRVGGRRKRAQSGGAASRNGDRGSGPTPAEIRAWARENGWDVPERGRVAAEVREAYEAAH